MGCSPSKGQRFTGALEPSSSARWLLQEDQEDSQPKREENTGNRDSACHLCEDTKLPVTCQEKSPSPVELTPVLLNSAETQDGENGIVFQQRRTQVNTTVEEQRGNAEETRSSKSEEGRHSEAEELPLALFKADFRDRDLAQANPGADGHISPSVSKYEALKNLLHQVTQTHRSLQPMTDLMAQHYEEINHQLEVMAEEGETLLREHENNLARIQPADQLQHVIQYTSAKPILGADSAGGSGYSALEDAVVYFATLSTLLHEKLRAKRAAEQRLAQVVARVGAMGPQRKHAPEDGSLHSEDSGIGAESESLNGFERPQRHADNSELHRFEHRHQECNQSVSINSNCSSAGDGRSLNRAKRATSLGNIAPHWLKQGMEQKPKSLQMVTSAGTKRSPPVNSALRRSWSVGSLCHQIGGTTLPQQCHHQQLSSTMGEAVSRVAVGYSVCSPLNKKFEQEGRQLQHPVLLASSPSQKKTSHCSQARHRRHSSQELEMGEKEKEGDVEGRTKGRKGDRALRVMPPPSPALITPELYSNSSVKRLINTFNCRENSNQTHNPSNASVISQGARKYDAPNKPGKTESYDTISDYNWQMGCRTYIKVEDSDVDPLPPPPPEVMMDNSFSRTDRSPDREGKVGMPSRACVASQHLHSSRQKVTSPSSCCSLHHQDTVAGSWARPDSLQESECDPKKEEADDLYHRDHKIIYLQDSAESSMNIVQTGQDRKIPLSLGSRVGTQGGSDGHSNGDTTILPAIRQPVTNPPISRKLKSSSQNLPRTLVVSQLATGSPEGSSSAPFNLPLLPSGQAGLISLASSPQSMPSAGLNHEVSHEVGTPVAMQSMSFQDAAQRETWVTSQSPTLPRPWGETPRSKLSLSAYSPQPFVRRCLSDRKPAGSALSRMSMTALSKVNQSQSRESALR